jgi:hypothetical protein
MVRYHHSCLGFPEVATPKTTQEHYILLCCCWILRKAIVNDGLPVTSP